MTAEEFSAAIAALGLPKVKAGPWLNLSARHGQRLAADQGAIPGPVAMVLRLALALNLSAEDVTRLTARSYQPRRGRGG